MFFANGFLVTHIFVDSRPEKHFAYKTTYKKNYFCALPFPHGLSQLRTSISSLAFPAAHLYFLIDTPSSAPLFPHWLSQYRTSISSLAIPAAHLYSSLTLPAAHLYFLVGSPSCALMPCNTAVRTHGCSKSISSGQFGLEFIQDLSTARTPPTPELSKPCHLFKLCQLSQATWSPPYKLQLAIIIIKKGLQWKAQREWYTPYQSEDLSPTIPTYRQKEEKGKKSRRL